MKEKAPSYSYYKKVFEGRRMPFAFVDMDLLDANIDAIRKRSAGKNIRVASKSIRCRFIQDYILNSDPIYEGLMCFTGEEAVWLSRQGNDDLLIAYPFNNKNVLGEIAEEIKTGKRIYVMMDSIESARKVNEIGKSMDVTFNVCIEGDMSDDLPGIHFGVFRSPLRTAEDVSELAKEIVKLKYLKVNAFMGYEAQVAGLGDRVPGQGVKAPVIRMLKKRSVKKVAQKRAAMIASLRAAGVEPEVVNGGGTGSMESTCAEAVVTEVTAGSGFFSSHLFDYYDHFHHLPAAGYAIEVVRIPQKGIYTCLGGGYVASGSLGIEKLPKPYLPVGAKLHENEAAGEVQTPVLYNGPEKLSPGSPVFMRHSKAGELCERFNSLLLVRGGEVVDEVLTYRGEGKCFL